MSSKKLGKETKKKVMIRSCECNPSLNKDFPEILRSTSEVISITNVYTDQLPAVAAVLSFVARDRFCIGPS